MKPRLLQLANWKMNKTGADARAFAADFLARELPSGTEVAIAAPFTALPDLHEALAGSPVGLAAQDVHWESSGAFTGEISAGMLADLSVRYVLCGHSERRAGFGESDARVSKKVRACLDQRLVPVLCIGESAAEREADRTQLVLETQLRLGCGEFPPAAIEFVLAYEPVWAIGTGVTATVAQVSQAHRFLRGMLARLLGGERAAATRILYGGSVTPDNAGPLATVPDVDGFLVGGASLSPQSFFTLIQAAAEARK